MKRQTWIALALVMVSGAAQAECLGGRWDACAVSSMASVAFTAAPFIMTENTTQMSAVRKVVLAAKDDAMAFVASQGEIQGAHLTRALQVVRANNADAVNVSDMQIAEAIVAEQ